MLEVLKHHGTCKNKKKHIKIIKITDVEVCVSVII